MVEREQIPSSIMPASKGSPIYRSIISHSGIVASVCLLTTWGFTHQRIFPSTVAIAAENQSPRLESKLQVAQILNTSCLQILYEWKTIAATGRFLDASEIAEFIADFEGEGHSKGGKLIPYRDPRGLEIIGYGYLITPQEKASGTIRIAGKAVPYRQGITKDQALQLLEQEISLLRQDIQKLVTVEPTPNQLDVLVSFAYNVGLDAFKTSTLLKKLNSGQHHEVPQELQRWTRVGHRQSAGLVKRRQAEAKLWNTPSNE